MHLSARSVLCVFLGCLISIDAYEPKFEGNKPASRFPNGIQYLRECNPTADPGFPFPEVIIETTSTKEPKIEHNSFKCRDPQFEPNTFYMLETIAHIGPGSKDTRTKYYTEQGRFIQYVPQVPIKVNRNPKQ